MATTIPLIDFEKYGLHVNSEDVPSEDLTEIGDQIVDAFRTIGFCYIKNHGIPHNEIEKIFQVSKTFFDLDETVKRKYIRPASTNHGWVENERESLNPERPGDLKEAFNFTPTDNGVWPDAELPEMQRDFKEFFEACKEMTFRILDVLAVGLQLEDRSFLRQCHKEIGVKNQTTIRSIMYPALPSDGSIKPGQVRCGEHSDYGTVTMLFQDGIGGLEVCNTKGDYIDATPVPDAICVNIGDLMQRWTSDKLIATKHRVLIPEDEVRRNKGRQSIAFFIHPDDDCMIRCLDGSDKYEPISALDYLKWRFSVTYY